MVDVVLWVFDKEATLGPVAPDGRVEVVVAGASVEVIARRLAGFGAGVKVLEPPEAREQLAAIGRELVATYG